MHSGDWDTFWPLFEQMSRLEWTDAKAAIILGGWHRAPGPGTSGLMPAPKRLLTKFARYVIHAEMCWLIEKADKTSPGTPQEEAALAPVWDHARKNKTHFIHTLDHGNWKLSRLHQAAFKATRTLEKSIVYDLLFLERTAFIFYPEPADPSAGWQDFFRFVHGYNTLPDDLKKRFGPYYLLIQLSSVSPPAPPSSPPTLPA